MQLSEDQTKQLLTWVKEGKTLSEIQVLINEKLEIPMTYMETRFLIDDLDIALPDKEEPKAQKEPEVEKAPTPTGSVSLSVDKITRPNALASGEVTFSDGVKATWQLDQAGRIGISPSTEGYKPAQADIEEFQQAINQELQKVGF